MRILLLELHRSTMCYFLSCLDVGQILSNGILAALEHCSCTRDPNGLFYFSDLEHRLQRFHINCTLLYYNNKRYCNEDILCSYLNNH